MEWDINRFSRNLPFFCSLIVPLVGHWSDSSWLAIRTHGSKKDLKNRFFLVSVRKVLVSVWTLCQFKSVLWSEKQKSCREVLIFQIKTRISENIYRDCKDHCRFSNLRSQKNNKYLNAKPSFWYKNKYRDQLENFGPGPGWNTNLVLRLWPLDRTLDSTDVID